MIGPTKYLPPKKGIASGKRRTKTESELEFYKQIMPSNLSFREPYT
jgi:hypothetical protein